MEILYTHNTIDTVLNDLTKLKNSNFDTSSFAQAWYTPTMDAFEPDANKLTSIVELSPELPGINILRKDKFITDEVFDDSKFDLWFDQTIELYRQQGYEYFDEYGNFSEEQCREHLKNNVKKNIGLTTSMLFKDQEGKEILISFCVTNNYRNPLDTIHTNFHELCHGLQRSFKVDKNVDKSQQFHKESKECNKLKEEYKNNPTAEVEKKLNKTYNIFYKNWYINNYIMETQANLFANTYIMLKTLLTHPEKAEEIKTELTNLASYNFFSGYNDYVLTKELMKEMCENPNKFLTDFTNEGEIDFKKCFDFTLGMVTNKSLEYSEYLDNEIEKDTNLLTLKENPKLYKTTDINDNPISSDHAAGKIHEKENHYENDILYNLENLVYHNLPNYLQDKNAFFSQCKEHINLNKNLLNKQQIQLESETIEQAVNAINQIEQFLDNKHNVQQPSI